jgi:progranulin
MKPTLQSLCTATFLLLLTGAEAGGHAPTAVRKLSPDSSEKLLREHLAFAPLLDQLPGDLSPFGVDNNIAGGYNYEYGSARFYRAFGAHRDDSESNVFRRAAEALALLQERSSCPPNMESCADIGSPNKCCQEGTYCTDVPDTMVGHVACCPDDTTCGGGVGDCPADAVSCPPDLGGGCCLGGWICQGIGCM